MKAIIAIIYHKLSKAEIGSFEVQQFCPQNST